MSTAVKEYTFEEVPAHHNGPENEKTSKVNSSILLPQNNVDVLDNCRALLYLNKLKYWALGSEIDKISKMTPHLLVVVNWIMNVFSKSLV